MAWTYWNEVEGPRERQTALTEKGRRAILKLPPDTAVFRWDFRLLRPVFLSGSFDAIFEHLNREIYIFEIWHDLLGITDFMFEPDLRTTAFTAITRPTKHEHQNTLRLLRWPTPQMRRMLSAIESERDMMLREGPTGRKRQKLALADPTKLVLGVATTLQEVLPRRPA